MPDPEITEARRQNLTGRSTRQVLEDHLRLRAAGEFEEDLRRNYAEDVVLLTENSILRGQDALRTSKDRLHRQLPGARYEFTARQVAGDYALLIWQARSDHCQVDCGADSFVITGGKIRMQTVHYRLLSSG